MCRAIISEPGFTVSDAAACTVEELTGLFQTWELAQLLGEAEKTRIDALGNKEYYEEAILATSDEEGRKFLRQQALDNLDASQMAAVAFRHLLAAINYKTTH